MIFKYFILDGRRILQGENVQYDDFIMSQRGQDFDAKHAELIEQGHTIEVILPEVDPE